MFKIFSIIVKTIHEPIFAKIKFDWDIKTRTARIEVPQVCGPERADPQPRHRYRAPHDHRAA